LSLPLSMPLSMPLSLLVSLPLSVLLSAGAIGLLSWVLFLPCLDSSQQDSGADKSAVPSTGHITCGY
jgi:hypothetical protein